MANIGTFTAEKDGFTGQLRTLTLNFKVKLVPNDKGENESAPDFRLQAAGHDFGAAWKKTSEAGRDYLSVAIDDPSFPATVYARLNEGENDTHDLIWSRSKPKAACRPPTAPRPLRRGAVLLIAASHAQGFGSCPMSRMSKASIALVMVEWLEARGSRNSMACRRIAPPGFRAAPHAANGVMSIRLQSLVSLKCVFGNAVTPGPARVRGWPQHVARHPSVPLEPVRESWAHARARSLKARTVA